MRNSGWRAPLVFRVLGWLGVLLATSGAQNSCELYRQWVQKVEKMPDWVEITDWPNLSFEVRYASTNNFVQADVYCGSQRVFLHKIAANQLRISQKWLAQHHPQLQFHIWDGARPLYAQEMLRAQVRGTPLAPFVSSPKPGGMHNYGMALDVTLKKRTGDLLDMGTDFDNFTIKSNATPSVEDSLWQMGEFTPAQVQNRRILRQAMRAGGFIQLPSEWWHYNAALSSWVRDSSGIIIP